MDLTPANLRNPTPSPNTPPPSGSSAWCKPTCHLADQPSRPEHDGDHEPEQKPAPADRQDELDEVDEASRESFPASDPPAFTPLHIGS